MRYLATLKKDVFEELMEGLDMILILKIEKNNIQISYIEFVLHFHARFFYFIIDCKINYIARDLHDLYEVTYNIGYMNT